MRFYTHEETPPRPASAQAKALLIIGLLLTYGISGYFTIFMWQEHDHILFRLFPAIAAAAFTFIVVFICYDLSKAYVEIRDQTVTVVDYYCFIKRQRHFAVQEIATVEEVFDIWGLHGYHLRSYHYLYFLDDRGKYLFKIIDLASTREQILQYLPHLEREKSST